MASREVTPHFKEKMKMNGTSPAKAAAKATKAAAKPPAKEPEKSAVSKEPARRRSDGGIVFGTCESGNHDKCHGVLPDGHGGSLMCQCECHSPVRAATEVAKKARAVKATKKKAAAPKRAAKKAVAKKTAKSSGNSRSRVDPASAEFTKLVNAAKSTGAATAGAVVRALRAQGYALSQTHGDRIKDLLG